MDKFLFEMSQCHFQRRPTVSIARLCSWLVMFMDLVCYWNCIIDWCFNLFHIYFLIGTLNFTTSRSLIIWYSKRCIGSNCKEVWTPLKCLITYFYFWRHINVAKFSTITIRLNYDYLWMVCLNINNSFMAKQ